MDYKQTWIWKIALFWFVKSLFGGGIIFDWLQSKFHLVIISLIIFTIIIIVIIIIIIIIYSTKSRFNNPCDMI